MNRISKKMLEVLTLVSLEFDQKSLSEATLNHMKSLLMSKLELSSSMSPVADYDVVMGRLNSFARDIIDGSKNRWIRSSDPGAACDFDAVAIRASEITQFWFTQEEMLEVSKLVIQRHDSEHKHHCNTVMCGTECEFAHVICENENCGLQLSKRYVPEHDAECVHKKVPCPRNCDDIVPRRLLQHHLEDDCELRVVPCTYCELGCEAG